MKVLITSGGTKVPIDRVRDITNMSTGTFGAKIGFETLKLGHKVVFYKAKNSKSPVSLNIDLVHTGYDIPTFTEWFNERAKYMRNYMEYEYVTFDQYAEGLKFVIGVEQPDVIVLAAAVSDYGVENYFDGKMRSNDLFNIKLKQLPKLINMVKEWAPRTKLVGFKMLVDSKESDLIIASKKSIDENGCDLVVANDYQDIKDNNHKVYLVSKILNKYIVEKYKASESNDSNYLARMVVKKSLNL